MSNNRQIALNTFYSLTSFVISLIISFFFTPYLIRVLGKETYSFFPLVNNLIGYSSIITTAVGSMAGRFITMKIYQGDSEGAKYYFNSVFIVNIILSLFFGIVFTFAIIYISSILTVPTYLLKDIKWLFALSSIGFVLGLSTDILGIGTFIRNRLDLGALRSVITNLVRLVSIFLLFYIFNPSIIYVSLSSLLAALLGVYYNLKFKRQLLPDIKIAPCRYFSWKVLKEVVFSGVWNSVNQLSVMLLTQLDLLITNVFIGVAATGDYAIAKMVPALIQSFVGVLVGVFVPQFTILYAKGNKLELLNEINKSIKMLGLCLTLPIGFLIINGDCFFNLWVPMQNTSMLHWLSNLTIIPMIITGSINTIFNVYSVTNKLKIPALVLLITGLLNTLVIFILLKTTELGLWAIPLTSLVIGLLRNLLFTPIYAAYCLQVKWYVFYKAITKGAVSCLVVMGIAYCCRLNFYAYNWWILIISAFVVSIISLLINAQLVLTKTEKKYFITKVYNFIKR